MPPVILRNLALVWTAPFTPAQALGVWHCRYRR